MEASQTDTRVVYGARCSWWDTIDKAGRKEPFVGRFTSQLQTGLPCCPHCGGVLMEYPDRDSWLADAMAFEFSHHFDGYYNFIVWAQGKCFSNTAAAIEAYNAETGSKLRTKP